MQGNPFVYSLSNFKPHHSYINPVIHSVEICLWKPTSPSIPDKPLLVLVVISLFQNYAC